MYFVPANAVRPPWPPAPRKPRATHRRTEVHGNMVPLGWKAERQTCPVCFKDCAVRPDGSLYTHYGNKRKYRQECVGNNVWRWTREPQEIPRYMAGQYLAALTGLKESLDAGPPERVSGIDSLPPGFDFLLPGIPHSPATHFSSGDAHARFVLAVERMVDRGIPFDLVDDSF